MYLSICYLTRFIPISIQVSFHSSWGWSRHEKTEKSMRSPSRYVFLLRNLPGLIFTIFHFLFSFDFFFFSSLLVIHLDLGIVHGMKFPSETVKFRYDGGDSLL